ncbi:MAPEG family protein [Oryzicola mucosus]|uniref:MAPEG family protein n=1 Tax=Oryzicola mucosus TaxID=2767425 RepID=A0A8J6PWU3_9HYPH|nr:MAPEG family protein [Oryzicola mucosus]MBD0415637.1 MAPEG family protein [Oryzicola mucosus]
MNQTAIFWPVIAQAVLTFIAYFVMYSRRMQAVKSGAADLRTFKRRNAEPEASETAANNILSQFELPVLFYVVCLSLYVTNGASYVALLLAWLFVASRYVHAYVHMTSNRLLYRRPIFIIGFVAVILMWLWFALHLLAVV